MAVVLHKRSACLFVEGWTFHPHTILWVFMLPPEQCVSALPFVSGRVTQRLEDQH